MRTHCRSLALALSFVLAAACGKDNGTPPPPDAGSSAFGLALIGDAIITLHPGDIRKLQVVLGQAEVGPVAGAKIHLEIADGDPAGATLDSTELTTSNGVAGAGAGVATVTLTAGAKTQFKILASAPDYAGVSPVAFSISVIPIKRLLQIVGSPQVHVSTDGESAGVTMYISSSVGLKARLLDQGTGLPIAGETLVFSLGPTSAPLNFSNSTKSATAVTSAAGDAQVFLISNTITYAGAQVTAQTQAGGVGAVTYSVTVNSNAPNTHCTSSQE